MGLLGPFSDRRAKLLAHHDTCQVLGTVDLQVLRECKATPPSLLLGCCVCQAGWVGHNDEYRWAESVYIAIDLAEHRIMWGALPEEVRRSLARLTCSWAASSACRAASASPSLLRSRCSAAQPFHARRGRQAALICRAGRPRQGQGLSELDKPDVDNQCS